MFVVLGQGYSIVGTVGTKRYQTDEALNRNRARYLNPFRNRYTAGISYGDSAAKPDNGRVIGPDYTTTTPTYAEDTGKRRSNCYRDEAYDFLNARQWPHRIANNPATSLT